MPSVLNKRKVGIPKGAVYIGRGSKWGNPFKIGEDGSRDEVIEKYRTWLIECGPVDAIDELVGKDLVCFCAPQRCHGDFLLEQAQRIVSVAEAGN